MSDLTKYILGIIAALFITSVIAIWKLIGGKADKLYLAELNKGNRDDFAKAVESLDREIKAVDLRVDNFIVLIGQSVSKTELIRDLNTASVRVDDKDMRVQKDIAELKSDIKTLTEKLTQVDKKLDDLPTRVAGLEQSRRVEQNK